MGVEGEVGFCRDSGIRLGHKNTTHTSTLSNAEVKSGTGFWRNVEVDGAVVPPLVSINCPQHLHHLRGRDRGIGEP